MASRSARLFHGPARIAASSVRPADSAASRPARNGSISPKSKGCFCLIIHLASREMAEALTSETESHENGEMATVVPLTYRCRLQETESALPMFVDLGSVRAAAPACRARPVAARSWRSLTITRIGDPITRGTVSRSAGPTGCCRATGAERVAAGSSGRRMHLRWRWLLHSCAPMKLST